MEDENPVLSCSDSSCALSCRNAASCNFNSSVIVTSTVGGGNKTITVSGNVSIAGNVTLSGAVTISLSPGSRLDVEKCLTLSDGATVQVLVTDTSTNGSVLATYDSTCSNVPIVQISSTLNECQSGRASVVATDDSSSRTRLELLFLPPSADCNSSNTGNPGLSTQTLGIIIGCVCGGLVLIVLGVVLLVPRIRHKVFPYSKRTVSAQDVGTGTPNQAVEMTTPSAGTKSSRPLSLIDESGAPAPMERSWKPSTRPSVQPE